MKAMPVPDLPCLCANLRRASRALTQIYEDALRPVGLRASQFTILQMLSIAGEVTQGQMAHLLAMDSTTLTRTLAIMLREGGSLGVRGRTGGSGGFNCRKQAGPSSSALFLDGRRPRHLYEKKLGVRRWDEAMQISNEITRAVSA